MYGARIFLGYPCAGDLVSPPKPPCFQLFQYLDLLGDGGEQGNMSCRDFYRG